VVGVGGADGAAGGLGHARGASEEWMGVYQGSHKIGYTQQSVVPDGDGYDSPRCRCCGYRCWGRRRRCTRSRRARRIITGPCVT